TSHTTTSQDPFHQQLLTGFQCIISTLPTTASLALFLKAFGPCFSLTSLWLTTSFRGLFLLVSPNTSLY
ncbi:unnamed protein product, partial [Closterium sp. NIES-64]